MAAVRVTPAKRVSMWVVRVLVLVVMMMMLMGPLLADAFGAMAVAICPIMTCVCKSLREHAALRS